MDNLKSCKFSKNNITTKISKSKSLVVGTNDLSSSSSDHYSCGECLKDGKSKYFVSQQKLSVHLRECHSSSSFNCDICFKLFRRNSVLNRHKTSVHSTAKQISCFICHSTFSIRTALQEHLFTVHELKMGNWVYFKCDLCSKEFAYKSRLKTHLLEKHVVDKEFDCFSCTKKFIGLQSLDRHKKIWHKSITAIFTCDVCSKEFAFKNYLSKHIKRNHLGHSYCTKCGRSFGNKSEFNQHLQTNPNNNTEAFECQVCSVMCTSQCQCTFDCHMESHIKKLKSDEAARSESQKTERDRAGGGIRCELCFETFDTESNLHSHRTSIHRIRTKIFKCLYKNCSETFSCTVMLQRHKLIHQGIEPSLPCDTLLKPHLLSSLFISFVQN